jgi:hypothetical protein
MTDSDQNNILARLDKLEDAMHDLTSLLRGDEGGPGLVGRVKRHHESLYGLDDREFGLVHKVNVVWRAYVWLLCTASAAAGMVALWVIQQLTGSQ